MPHPCGVSSQPIKSPLPDFTSGAQKVIETAIKNNDVEFFYRLYLTKMVELSMTGQGKEFFEHAKTALDNSENSLYMSKGFEAIGNLIDCEFTKCSVILDELEESTRGNELSLWVNQISNLCRAYINFYNGDYKQALKCAQVALDGVPTHPLHWAIRRVGVARTLKRTRIRPHLRNPLRLCHFITPNVEGICMRH